MIFSIEDDVFQALPEVCFGVVTAYDLDNHPDREYSRKRLDSAIRETREKFNGHNIKEHPDLLCYRKAFQELGINPNKFPSSVEALTTRVLKGGNLPYINGVVNLVNAISLHYTLPMGAHDLSFPLMVLKTAIVLRLWLPGMNLQASWSRPFTAG